MIETPNFFPSIKHSLKNSFDFKGRARQSELWYFWIFGGFAPLLLLPLDVVSLMVSGFKYEFFPFVYSASALLLLPFASISCRRSHDVGLSALWLWWVPFALLIGEFCQWANIIPFQSNWSVLNVFISALAVFAILCHVTFMYGVLKLLFEDGQKKTNRYGPSSKYPDVLP